VKRGATAVAVLSLAVTEPPEVFYCQRIPAGASCSGSEALA
jgi:hypothetical protein